jgi:hypothetical protein
VGVKKEKTIDRGDRAEVPEMVKGVTFVQLTPKDVIFNQTV